MDNYLLGNVIALGHLDELELLDADVPTTIFKPLKVLMTEWQKVNCLLASQFSDEAHFFYEYGVI